jgi:hypothetical protein
MQTPAILPFGSPANGTRPRVSCGWQLFRWSSALLLLACPILLHAEGSVSDCTEADLRAALAGGGEVTFSEDCKITLGAPVDISTDTTIDANGFDVTITASTNSSIRLFSVAPGASFKLIGLTLQGGRSTNGGAIYIDSEAVVQITDCKFLANSAIGTNGSAGADGEDNSFANGANGRAGADGNPGRGGAIYNLGELAIQTSTFLTNTVTGGNGGTGGKGGDGGWNAGNGGDGGEGAEAEGGAIFNLGQLTLTDCTFAYNTGKAGDGGSGGAAGTGSFLGFAGIGAAGGHARGGAVYSSSNMSIANCTFSGNAVSGGGSASGGTQLSGNGSEGIQGGNAYGGAVANHGEGALINCTVAGNTARGGAGGNGGGGSWTAGDGGNGGNAYGGGIFNGNTLTVLHCTVANCSAVGGTNGIAGSGAFFGQPGNPGRSQGSGVSNRDGTFTLKNTILGISASGGTGYGTFVDEGNNLSADKSVALGTSSKINTDPKLGALGDHGGPTETMLPLPGSPAANAAAPVEDLEEDQRGFPRPETLGGQSDIGAVEGRLPTIASQPQDQLSHLGATVSFSVSATGELPLLYSWSFNSTNKITGATNASYTVIRVASTNLGSYTVVVSNAFGSVTSAPALLSVGSPPTILVQPTNQFVSQGGDAQFSVVASGTTTLSYQWKKDAKLIAGATNAGLSLQNVQATNAGSYTVTVSSSAGSTTSQQAFLEVFSFMTIGASSNLLTISIPTLTNHNYVLSYKTNLLDASWTPLQTNSGTGNPVIFQEPTTNGPARFYKTVVQ